MLLIGPRAGEYRAYSVNYKTLMSDGRLNTEEEQVLLVLRVEGVAGSACTTTSGPLGARITGTPLFYLVLFLAGRCSASPSSLRIRFSGGRK